MNNKNFAVGLFVALALAIFVAATLWLTGKQGSEPTVNYSVFFEKDVGGLMLGGPVFYLGVNVGTVTAMTIIPGNPMSVRVDVEVLESAPIDGGTYASLALQGITGVAVIKFLADPGVHEPLQAGGNGGNPVIPVRDTGFTALLAKAPAVVDKLDSILVNVNEILGQENRDFVSEMLEDISDITGALAAKEETIGELPVLLKQAIEDLQGNLRQIKTLVGNLEPGLQSTVASLEQTMQNLESMTARLEVMTETNEKDLNAFLGDGLGQVPALITDLRSTLREVDKLLKGLREDPSKLIYKPIHDAIDVEQ
jgi:phospholipid/cholesterol/gamma-HCH transport system substrate-binding protein